MKKNLGILLLAALLLTACGEAGTTVAEDTKAASDTEAVTEVVTEDTTPVADLPEKDYSGAEFHFLSMTMPDWYMISTIICEEETGESLNDAIYRRNRATEEKYNVKLTQYQTDSFESEAKKAVAAGDSYYDAFTVQKAAMMTLTIAHSLYEYSEIPYLELDMPWWVQTATEAMSFANKVYFGISMFDTSHYDGVRTFFFNKTMHDQFDLPDIYQLVKDGKWTLDAFREMGMAVGADIDGDGQWTENDRYGYTSYDDISIESLCAGSGVSLTVHKDADGYPVFDLNTDYYINRLQKIAETLQAGDGFVNPKSSSENHGGVDFFKAGLALFYNETLGNAQKLRQMELDFGIIPTPKYDEAQESYYCEGGNPMFLAVPVTNGDIERTGIILESLAYESMTTVKVAAYNDMLMGKVSRDNDSEEMLDIMFSHLTYCHPTGLSQINTLLKNIWKGKTDFASSFEKIAPKVQKEIDKVVASYNE